MRKEDGRTRRERVVVLARGRGTRMGKPKAALRLPGEDCTFLSRVLDLYDPKGWPVSVVIREGGGRSCREAAPGRKFVLVEGPETGDTALTLLAARATGEPGVPFPTHWWAHPVDLPLVGPPSVDVLAEASRSHPDRVVRPVFQGRPGHPVVVPDGVLAALAGQPDWHEGPLRYFLEHMVRTGQGQPILTVTVPDGGVVQDFDRPADLAAWRPETGGRDEQS